MEYKLVAVDMDGTLLTPQLEISKKTVETINRVIEKGVVFTLSTGRMYLAAMPFANMLNLDVPIITCNGALIKCSKTGKVYDAKIIDKEYSSKIISYCEEAGLSVSIYREDDIYVKKNSENLDIHIQLDHAKPQIVNDFDSLLEGSIIKIMFNSSNKYNLEQHTRKLFELYKEKLNFYFSLPHFVEIVNKEANKSNALQNLALKFNIKREETIAIGDNFNDMDMIEYAGLGVAMGNAPDYLKDAADFVTHSNDEDGVRHVLENFILK
ncbi:Cof-type HAD-IIB family hydrolase [Clostridium sp. CF011]|uniref:Cof-type HAD-IIB family hydrolase n=1 Tax=Clostridium sp. CF011 TaxID=2843318 RepID=UPI001C0BF63A|nr:Cof-type HAD-IIB family hydrolase [Clostridium sp. CF011]MBU3092053.1 Cof-type HAD-IIB family hydrolase [Clostridium sp. CF011]WAG71335.1 Cof-type HAD-IIB family hydrolase [Clostridium sp. CF011]